MQVKGLNLSTKAWPNWTLFLKRSTLLSASLLLGSALVMAVAANWASWPYLGRIALVELCVAVFVCVAIWLARHEPKEWATAYRLSSLAYLLAAISVGALLALIGQSYQTGADPWQLFALWAVLLMPWAFGLGSLFMILLVQLLTNLALGLFVEGQVSPLAWMFASHEHDAVYFVFLNAIWLAASRLVGQRYFDPYQLWFKLSFVLLVGSGVSWCVMQNTSGWDVLTVACVLTALISYFSRRRGEVWQLAVWYSALFILILAWLLMGLRSFYGSILFVLLPMSVVAVCLLRDLRNQWHQQERLKQDAETTQTEPSEPWFLRVFTILVQAVVVVLFILFVLVVLNIDATELAYWYLPGVFVGLLYLLRSEQLSSWLQDIPLFLLGSSAFFMGVLFVSSETWTLLWVAVFGLGLAVIYCFSAGHYLVRLGSAVLGLGVLIYGWFWQFDFDIHATQRIYWLVGLLWLGLSVWLSLVPSSRQNWQPLWWASLLWIGILAVSGEAFDLSWAYFVALSVPLLLVIGLRGAQSRRFNAIAVLLAAVLSLFWLVDAPFVNVALAVWLLSYQWKQRRLLVLAVLLFLMALAQYYYVLDTTLLQKSWDLTQGALLLGLSGWLLHRHATSVPSSQATPMIAVPDARRLQWVLFGGWALIVAVTVWDVARKEQLLAQGQTLVLELAPVDPRSLMQGDYMALRFTVGQALSWFESLSEQDTVGRKLLVYLQPQDEGPALLVAMKNPATDQVWLWQDSSHSWSKAPSSYQPDSTLLALPFKKKGGEWLPNGVDAWFFPEGEAYRYEQARYGVFKVNRNADALLYELN